MNWQAGRNARRVAHRLLPRKLVPQARKFAIRRGWVEEAPFQYPFWQLLAREGLRSYPQYFWGTCCAAALASALEIDRIAVVEFGVAGGNGLLALETIAADVAQRSGVEIEVYGFDTGSGLPKPQDYRDLPQMWSEGAFAMDVDALRRRLTSAELILGPVAETVPAFAANVSCPVGFVAFDLDMYTSTIDAFSLLEASGSALLPRIVCYFDDIIGFSHSEFTGERLAIKEFNQRHQTRKISKLYGLRYVLDLDHWWTDMMYMFHAFDHPRYADNDGTNRLDALPLAPE
jgi:hypothetical protein